MRKYWEMMRNTTKLKIIILAKIGVIMKKITIMEKNGKMKEKTIKVMIIRIEI